MTTTRRTGRAPELRRLVSGAVRAAACLAPIAGAPGAVVPIALAPVALAPVSASAQSAPLPSLTVFGVTEAPAAGGQKLVRFSSTTPGTIEASVPIVGLPAGTKVVSIDYRPCLCGLYGLLDSGDVYDINPATGLTKRIEKAPRVTLSGSAFDMDFNPTDDFVTILSDDGTRTGYDLGDNPPVVTARPSLTYAAGTPGTPSVSAVGYSNNRQEATFTRLYGLDRNSGSLVTIDESTGVVTPVGPLGVAVDGVDGFDIGAPQAQFFKAVGLVRRAGQAGQSLVVVDLDTGRADVLGEVGGGERLADVSINLGGDLSLPAAPVSVSETQREVAVTVARTRGSEGVAKVDFFVSSDKAKFGPDFTLAPPFTGQAGTLTFPKDSASASFTILLVDDGRGEGNETLKVKLSSPQGGTIITGSGEYDVTVVDDDPGATGGFSPNVLGVSLPSRVTAARAARGIRGSLTCTQECSQSTKLVVSGGTARRVGLVGRGRRAPREVTVGSARRATFAAGRQSLSVRLSSAAKRVLARRRTISATARVTATDRSGLTTTVAKRVTVTP